MRSKADADADVNADAEAFASEARRQIALLATLASPANDVAGLGLCGSPHQVAQGLAVYRANAAASAERALAAVFGTVQAMVGESDFALLARAFWQAHPPQRGDLGEWGEALPAWLQAHAALQAWPWLGDCAALDLALHRCERAADAALDTASLALLESHEPAALRLVVMPGLSLLRSAWPVATIHAAHHAGDADGDPFVAVRTALAEGRGEAVLVARRGWRGVPHRVCEPTAGWMQNVLAGLNLAACLDQAAEQFDFAAWLALALREGWVQGVATVFD